MNNLTLRQLRYFDALAREGHFGRAAERCAISQPALSVQIRDLEESLGFALFERGPRQVRLTARGALQRNGEAAAAIVINATGHIKEFDPGSFEAGAVTEAAFTMGLRYYRLELDGGVIQEVDVENMVRVINGVDQLRSQRAAIGI